MLKVTVEGEVFEFDSGRILNTEAIALQKETGFTPPEFGDALDKGDAIALTGLVWLLWRRNGRHVKFAECEFNMMAIRLEADDAADEADETDRPTGEVAAPRKTGKVTSKRAASGTSSPSRTTST